MCPSPCRPAIDGSQLLGPRPRLPGLPEDEPASAESAEIHREWYVVSGAFEVRQLKRSRTPPGFQQLDWDLPQNPVQYSGFTDTSAVFARICT